MIAPMMALILGMLLGFVSAIPVAGPISAIVFGHAMKGRFTQARGVAAGAALVEAGYAALALWGFHQFLEDYRYIVPISNGLAALILGVLGIHFFRSKSMRTPGPSREENERPAHNAFMMGASICAINPTLIATWTAAITIVHSFQRIEFSTANSVLFAIGVGIGIFGWFSTLISLMGRYRDQLKPRPLDLALKGIGSVLIVLSIGMLYRLLDWKS